MSTQARRPAVPPHPAGRPEEHRAAAAGPGAPPPRPALPPKPAAPPAAARPDEQPPVEDRAAPPKTRRTFPAFPAPRATPPRAPVPPQPPTPDPGPPETPRPTPRPRGRWSTGAVDLTPRPGAGAPFAAAPRGPERDEATTRLRPVPRSPRRRAAAVCLVLGLGLVAGGATGTWLTGGDSAGAAADSFTAGAALWHDAPVDRLFPPTVKGRKAGPGGADRTWTRIAVAPDSGCAKALDPLLASVLEPVGCARLLRATYTDATRSEVVTVGLLFTRAGEQAMTDLRTRFRAEKLDRRRDLMPRPYAAKDTLAEGFGDPQRASWSVAVLADLPAVVYAVSGFADGREVTEPQPAAAATADGATTAPAQAGLGHTALAHTDRAAARLRGLAHRATEES
ncbi:hypothetical protein [Streptomyces sp. NPDC058374]|uniref:hypothetical protein n=1 Tax=Streptomyces sp. NPDC058374 TaxID=3346466 RepID=UPI00364A388B